MKKIVLSTLLLLALAMVATPTMAQQGKSRTQAKPTVAKGNKTPANKGDKSTDKVFHGTIYYTIAEEHSPKAAPQNDVNPAQQKSEVAVSALPEYYAEMEKKGDEFRFHYTFFDTICYAQMCGIRYSFSPEKNMEVLCGMRPEEPYRGAERKLCAFKGVNCALFNKVWDLQVAGDDKGSNAILDKYYTRTNETKVIAGHKAIRYDLAGNFGKGSIWVAEDMNLDTWFAPFWGIKHPVLEFNFGYHVEGVEDILIHVTADEIVDKTDIQLVKEIGGVEIIDIEEVQNMVRETAEMFRR